MFEIEGDLVICDPAIITDAKPEVTFYTGVGPCYMTIHPVEEYKNYISGREFYIKEKLNLAYSGYLPRAIGKIGTDSGKFGIFKLENIKNLSVLKKGESYKLRGFKGRFSRFNDSYGMAHLYTSGNYNFYTI